MTGDKDHEENLANVVSTLSLTRSVTKESLKGEIFSLNRNIKGAKEKLV